MNIRRTASRLCVVIALAIARPVFGQQLDVIRGRVIGPDSQPVSGVLVRATSYSGNVTKTGKTDKNGRFSITYPNGEGDYWLDFAAIGYVPKRFELKRVADEEILLADTRLASSIATLDQVNVTANANRALVNRNDQSANVGGGEKALSTTGVPPDQMGNLAAMAAGVPGIQLIPGLNGAADVFSALGLSADQNSTTFNGLGSGINTLPPDAQVRASVLTYSYDPAIGNFSGARIALVSQPGTNYSFRQASTNAVAPQLEFADDVAQAQNQKYTNLQLGAGGRGPITMDRHFYNSSFGLTRNFKDLPSLLNTSPLGLTSAGVAADSVTRLLSILRQASIPATTSGAPSVQATDAMNVQSNFDLTPSRSGTGNALTLGFLGNYRRSQQVTGFGGSSILTTPAHNGQSTQWSGIASLRHTNYFWFGILSNTNLGLSMSGTDNEPYLRLPNGNVRINSIFADGSSAVRALSFGGNQALALGQRSQTLELSNEMRWYAGNNRHAVKLTSDVRKEGFSADQGANLFGSFSFNSLAELQAGQAATFSRTLFAPQRKGDQVTASFSLGDFWRPSPDVQVQYGLRLDANRFLNTPSVNPLVEAKLGVRNDNVPNHAYLSPRLGFTWIYGDAPQIAFIPGAARPPRALIQGGIGVFQNLRGPDLISAAVENTGLAASTRQISCTGSAVPVPTWSTYGATSNIPSTCADGTAGTVFSNSAPNVTVFDGAFQQTRVWRTNLNWGGPMLDNRFALGVSAVYSLNLNQADAVDRNFRGTQRFALDHEGGRPVYANPSAIDPRTGAIALLDTRITTDLLRVSETRSELRSDASQLLFTLRPITANPRLRWNASYQLLALRDKYRGFSSTAGSPFDVSWGRSLQPGRHQVSVGLSDFPILDVVYISWGLMFSSGATFTPSIQGDVNGDGSAFNDRAYVFDPASVTDPAMASAMSTLLSTGSSAGRTCLTRQLGRLASRGSCSAPWNTQASLSFRFNPQKIGLPQRASVNFSINNPLGLADLVVHGQNIRGWGQNIAPDQSLLFVRGFDPATRRYKYEVNQRFGSTLPTQSTTRVLPLVSLRVQLDIGVPRERQVLTQRLDMGRGRPGTKSTAPLLKSLGSSTIPNPMALILQQPDSLKLTRKQADSLSALSRAFTQKADALWTPVAKYLESLPEGYDKSGAYERYVVARQQTVDFLMTLVPDVKRVLTKAQKRRLPLQILNFLDERVLKFMRTSSAGVETSPFIIR